MQAVEQCISSCSQLHRALEHVLLEHLTQKSSAPAVAGVASN